MKIIAVYPDQSGHEHTAPVIHTDRGWMLSTDFGYREISYYIEEKTADGGVITFSDYRLRAPGLRSCDYISRMNTIRATLPYPQKPFTHPPITEEKDSRLHVQGTGYRAWHQLEEGQWRYAFHNGT